MPKGCKDIQDIDDFITGDRIRIKLPKYIRKVIDMAYKYIIPKRKG